MDILSLILSCSVTLNFDDQYIASFIQVESFSNPIYIRAEGQKYGVGFDSKSDAVKAVETINQTNKESYIGLMGIPYSDAKDNGFSATLLLDPCINIQYGTATIDMHINECNARGKIDKLTCVINKYSSYTGQKRTYFISEVLTSDPIIYSKKHKNIQIDGKNNAEIHLESDSSITINLDNKKTKDQNIFIDYTLKTKEN